MDDAKHNSPQHPAWFDATSGNLTDFVASLTASSEPADLPFSDRIEQQVPIYAGNSIRNLDAAQAPTLMAEWARVLMDGPGIIVIKETFGDPSVIDRATGVFEQMITAQRQTGEGGGDHFAKPGANDRVWNGLQKHCLADPEGFALYYGNAVLEMAARAWLGPNYQLTAQVNRVNPGGAAQSAHRDYHLGFMTAEQAAAYPAHVHRLTAALTLQGAVAHCDMPLESGPTMYLPYSQRYAAGYVAVGRPEFQDYFRENHVQLPLSKGDAVFFNPALMHSAGHNRTTDIYRMANLLQVSSAFGRAMEVMDRTGMARALLSPLKVLLANGALSQVQAEAAIAACAEGYAFPTNLDTDPPVGGLAPVSQADLLRKALADGKSPADFASDLEAWTQRRRP